MRAIVFDGGLSFRHDYPKPASGPDTALVRVSYAGICSTDLEILKGYMGFTGVPGHEFSGVVEDCGVKGLIGKRVTGEINIGCGGCAWCVGGLANHCPNRGVLGILKKDGAFADYLTLPVKNLHLIPEEIADEEAVFVEPVAAAFEILEEVEITADKRVCVLGDGKLGLIAAEVLKLTGCALTLAGRHREKLAIVEKMGIRVTDSTDKLARGFDVVVDCTGSAGGLGEALALVRPRGTVVLKTTVSKWEGVDLNRVVIDEITLVGSRCGPFVPAIKAMAEGAVKVRPLISKVFPLEEGVEALEYASNRGALKVLLKMNAVD